jgi:hypothetical protein
MIRRAKQTLSILIAIALAGCHGLGGISQGPQPRRETGRSYLVGSELEAHGYGLYSYILFDSQPTEASKERYIRSIIAYFSISPMSSMEAFLPPEELNITYLLLRDRPPENIETCLQEQCCGEEYKLAEWVIEHYNYARAQAILCKVPGTRRSGPYIISYYRPLTWVTRLHGQYLHQDLSMVPQHLVQQWVMEFLEQVSLQHYWDEINLKQFSLKLLTAIEIIADGLPDVIAALKRWITWVR